MKKLLQTCGAILILAAPALAGDLVRTEIVTFPAGGKIEINGKYLGASPLIVTLPQDRKGKITGRTVIRALPVTAGREAVTKEMTGEEQKQVPVRILLRLEEMPEKAVPAKPKSTETRQGHRH